MTQLNRRDFLLASAGAVLAGAGVRAEEAKAGPRFTLGLVSYNIAARWDLPTLLKVCQDVGISPVEFRTTHRHGVEPTLSKEQRLEVKKRCADAGIVIWGCGTACEFHSPDQAVVKKQIETCKQFVELVHDIGGKGVKVRPNGLPAGVPVEKTLEQIGKALIPCGQAAADAGVEIWVEVHGRGTAHPPHVKTIMDHCGHRSVGLTWNSNKDDIKDGSVAEYFNLLWPHIKSVHINELANDARGVYPYRELFKLLQAKGYDRTTLIEYGKFFEPEEGAKFLREYKALWQKLCQA